MKYRRLSLEEREFIWDGLQKGKTQAQIAQEINRSESTVCRELQRNLTAERGGYLPVRASGLAQARAANCHRKRRKLSEGSSLFKLVYSKLRRRWSPRQIAEWLRIRYKDKPEMQVSHETIYEYIYVQAKGAFKKELIGYLRQSKANRKPHKGRSAEKRGKISDMISIHQRPRRSGRPYDAGPLGRRPDHRQGSLERHRHTGGAADPVRRPGQGQRARSRGGAQGLCSTDEEIS